MAHREAVFLILMCIAYTTYVVFDAAATPVCVHEATWEPPEIEQCDKELWERIREGCDD